MPTIVVGMLTCEKELISGETDANVCVNGAICSNRNCSDFAGFRYRV